MIKLRPYQDESIEALRAKFREGFTAVVLVLMTGAGKTLCAASIMKGALENGSKLLFVAHRRELIAQTYMKLVEMEVPENQIGIIMGSGKIHVKGGRVINASRKDAPIQIASIQTLRNRYHPPADIVFLDESHACLSQSYLDLKAKHPKAIHIGLTATPFRYGGKGLHSYYDAMVIGALPSMLIRDGYIVNPSVWTVPTDQRPDLTDVKTSNGDFNQKQLAKACNKNTLVGSIVEHWKSHAGNRRTICFPVDIAHSRHIVSDFIDAGVAAEHLDGTTPSDMRDAILRRLESGETLVVSSVGCLQEGFDCPPVKCVILARPTKSTGLFMQMAGRILRPWNDTSAIILDHAGCVLMHGLPSEDREFTLEDTGLNRKSDSTQTCKKCFAVFESGVEACPACGMPVPAGGGGGGDRTLKQVDGQLVEYSDADRQLERRAYWDQLCRLSVQDSHKPGWVKAEFKKKFGHYPPKSYPPPAERPRTPGEIDVLRAKMARVARERGLPGAWVDKKVTAATTPAQAQLVLMSHVSKPLKVNESVPTRAVALAIAAKGETAISIVPQSEIGKWDI